MRERQSVPRVQHVRYTPTRTHKVNAHTQRTIYLTHKKTDALTIHTAHTQAVNAVAVHDNHVYSASADKTIRVWDLTTHTAVAVIDLHHKGSINALVVGTGHFDPTLYSCSDDGICVCMHLCACM